MMQAAYGEVQQLYARIGVEVGDAGVMPDHIGAELNFLAILFDRMVTEPEKHAQFEVLAEELLAKHLRNWIPRFTVDMEEASETPFFKALAKITRVAV